MTQRTSKVSSQIQQVVAAELQVQLRAPEVSVRGVTVSPDLRQATAWIAVVKTQRNDPANLFSQVESLRKPLQNAVARHLTTKFVPRLHIKLDTGGEYAEHIGRLMNDL
jgi:ribosome-binding factor A